MNKKVLLVVLGVLLCLTLGVGVSYAYYLVTVKQSNSNVVKSSCLSLAIANEENVIKLEKQIPIRNSEGKDLTPYTFTITNTCSSFISYSLNLEELEGSTLASKYIMTMVNDKSYVNMASLSSTDKYYDSSVEARVLVTGSLGAKASVDYSLRLWMDEDTPLTSDAMNKSFRSKVVVVATPTNVVEFDYTGTEQVFTAPVSGNYKIELWGAQGGNTKYDVGGYGGYSSGNVELKENDKIYINVGGQGTSNNNYGPVLELLPGGYNGGGDVAAYAECCSGHMIAAGCGASHVALQSGLLSSLENNISDILMVSGGGSGGFKHYLAEYDYHAGSGGGYIGVKSNNYYKAGTQNSGYAFGQGGQPTDLARQSGGGGFYGGTGAGGSGYIGNPLLTDKAMYCYNCEESNEEDTKTISTTCVEETPTEKCAKKGNGYAKITYIGSN